MPGVDLVWDGKYSEDGKLERVPRYSLPFQTVETINESTRDRQQSLGFGMQREWRNRLIWGDKKYVLPSLLSEFAGKVDLIYIDPPFLTGANFSFTATIPPGPRSDEEPGIEFVKEPSIIEQKAYRDTWGRNTNSYLKWLYETFYFLRQLLADTGSIFVHLDVHRGPYAKIILDEVFGIDNFQNEIAWYYYNKLHGASKRTLPKAFDQILYYVKNRGSDYTFNTLTEPRDQPVTKIKYRFIGGKIVNEKDENGKVITYESTERQIDNVWRIRALQPANKQEWVNFDTQKPVDLIERILQVASKENDLILDCFCGSGSSLVAASRMNRRWLGADLSRFAIHTTRKRLLEVPDVAPFDIQNLGRYERQQWQVSEFQSNSEATNTDDKIDRYTSFIIDLYRGQRLRGNPWIHGTKSSRYVHVGSVDAPVTASDVTNIVAAMKNMIGSGANAPKTNAIDILGWDFAFDVNEVVQQHAAAAKLRLRFFRIPKDVMDPQALEQGDIYFFELAALSVDVAKLKNRKVTLKLLDFTIPPDDVPDEVRKEVKHWSQWIDYWAIDWDFKNDTFHNQWQTYRTRRDPHIELSSSYTYPAGGKYSVLVKVVDILGNDTTKMIEISI